MVDIEVIYRHLYYNLLLDRSWSYEMTAIVSSVFWLILFPLDGKIVTVDQLSAFTLDYSTLPSSTVPLVGGITDSYVSVGTSSNPLPHNDLHIERPIADLAIRPPKGTLRRTIHNTSARAAQN